jgi:hypothetical protein
MRKRTARKGCNAPCPYPIGRVPRYAGRRRTLGGDPSCATLQYHGLDSFTDVGPFLPLARHKDGLLLRQVAAARFSLALPE